MKKDFLKSKTLLVLLTLVVIVAIGFYTQIWQRDQSDSNIENNNTDSPYNISRKHNVLQQTQFNPNALPIGAIVDGFEFETVQGEKYTLDSLIKQGPAVMVFFSNHCPVALRYTQRLNRLYAEFASQGVFIFGINANEGEPLASVKKYAREMDCRFPVVKDSTGQIARILGASMTPQAFVIDRRRILRYRGAIDDNRYENRVKQRYLYDALTALLNNRAVPLEQAHAFGCTIHLPELIPVSTEVTYAEHIGPIIQQNCQPCHRPGQVAPFSLLTYRDAKIWSKEIAYYTRKRLMPPWRPAPGYGQFQNDRSLTEKEIALISRWAEAGTPSGDLDKLLPNPVFSDDWALGKPDFIAEMPVEYEIAPEGEDEFRIYVIPTSFDRDVYIRAMDVQPGNRRVVHHVDVIVDTTKTFRQRDASDDMPGFGFTAYTPTEPSMLQKLKYKFSKLLPGSRPAAPQIERVKPGQAFLGVWGPGVNPVVLPDGIGDIIPKGSDIVIRMHYYRTGKIEKDRTRVGFYFSKLPRPIVPHFTIITNNDFVIPAGATRHEVRAKYQLENDIYLFSLAPHMHLLGREMKVTATLPNQETVPLVWIKEYGFNWQDFYTYKTPLFLPKGTEIKVLAYFDNSSQNPYNPHDPPKTIRYGIRTEDEMCKVALRYVNKVDYKMAE